MPAARDFQAAAHIRELAFDDVAEPQLDVRRGDARRGAPA